MFAGLDALDNSTLVRADFANFERAHRCRIPHKIKSCRTAQGASGDLTLGDTQLAQLLDLARCSVGCANPAAKVRGKVDEAVEVNSYRERYTAALFGQCRNSSHVISISSVIRSCCTPARTHAIGSRNFAKDPRNSRQRCESRDDSRVCRPEK